MNSVIKSRCAALLLTITTTEVTAAALPFGEIDLNGDGAVSREELKQFRIAAAFANDKDGNGVLSRNEFRSILPARLPAAMHGRAFARVDTSSDGAIQPEEIHAMPIRAFDESDADGDGRLAGEELERFAARGGMR